MIDSLLRRPNPHRKPVEPGDPRLIATYRFQFWVYAVRHVLGSLFFGFLTWQAFTLQAAPIGYALALFGLVYTGFVAMNLRKLFVAWKKNEAVRREKEAASPAPRKD
jgi:hypothetical protein